MLIVLLKFGENRSNAGDHMDGHNAWLKQGFDDGIFLLAGTLQPKQGGAIITHGIAHADLETRLRQDPFVQEHVVVHEILDIDPARVDQRLDFLKS